MRKLLTVLAALVLGLGSLMAQPAARLALVVGNADYAGAAVLANPVNDATDLAAALQGLGWTVTRVLNADRKSLNRAVLDFKKALAARPGANALLFYAGHGVQVDGQNYLIPVRETFDSEDDVRTDAVGLNFVLDAFAEAKVGLNIVILDACRDNPFARASRSLGAGRGLGVIRNADAAEGSVVLFSTAPGSTAADGRGRNGVFTQALLKYLPSGLKLQDLTTKVTGEVKRVTGGQQVPYSSISLSDDYYLGPAAAAAAAAPASTTTTLPAPSWAPLGWQRWADLDLSRSPVTLRLCTDRWGGERVIDNDGKPTNRPFMSTPGNYSGQGQVLLPWPGSPGTFQLASYDHDVAGKVLMVDPGTGGGLRYAVPDAATVDRSLWTWVPGADDQSAYLVNKALGPGYRLTAPLNPADPLRVLPVGPPPVAAGQSWKAVVFSQLSM